MVRVAGKRMTPSSFRRRPHRTAPPHSTAPRAGYDIDAVVTWVDGADPAHRAKIRAHRPDGYHEEASSPTRFDDKR